MKRERILSLFLVLVLVFQTGGITSKAYVLNGYKITTPTSIPIYCDSAANASRINTYAKKWNACSEVYLYVGNSASAYIHSTVTNESTGAYGITYHHSNNNHSIVFYHS